MISVIPQKLIFAIIGTYVLSLLVISAFFYEMALTPLWIVFGSVEVFLFCILSWGISHWWQPLPYKKFVKRLFVFSLLLRLAYVVFSYYFYLYHNDNPFEFYAGDSLFYHRIAHLGADFLRSGHFDILNYLLAAGLSFSDCGYSLYLSVVYAISDDSILFARLLKALWGAWTVTLLYKVCIRHFDFQTAALAAILCMLFPNMLLYCGLHLKEIEMVFVLTLFIERSDNLLHTKKFKLSQTLLVALLLLVLFSFRTVLGTVAFLSLALTFLLTRTPGVNTQRRLTTSLIFGVFFSAMMLQNNMVQEEVASIFEYDVAGQQQQNMEWRSHRKMGNKLAKYASASVFAPLIFTIPFATMVDIPGQENQKIIHGGNFLKNVLSFFVLAALLSLIVSGEWREHVLLISLYGGYLTVLVFSSFAHSERFHLPALPLFLALVAHSIAQWNTSKTKKWFPLWCLFIVVCLIGWNWFKLKGRGYA